MTSTRIVMKINPKEALYLADMTFVSSKLTQNLVMLGQPKINYHMRSCISLLFIFLSTLTMLKWRFKALTFHIK